MCLLLSQVEEEADEAVNQVLDDLGIDLATRMGSVPMSTIREREQQPKEDSRISDDLEMRLRALRHS